MDKNGPKITRWPNASEKQRRYERSLINLETGGKVEKGSMIFEYFAHSAYVTCTTCNTCNILRFKPPPQKLRLKN